MKKIISGGNEFSFFNESLSFDSYDIDSIAQCEFLTLSPNEKVVSIRSTDQQIDLLASDTLSKVA